MWPPFSSFKWGWMGMSVSYQGECVAQCCSPALLSFHPSLVFEISKSKMSRREVSSLPGADSLAPEPEEEIVAQFDTAPKENLDEKPDIDQEEEEETQTCGCLKKVQRAFAVVVPYGGLLASSFNMASATLGAGIISLPSGFNLSGVAMATVYLLLITAATVYSMNLLARIMIQTGLKNYSMAARKLLGVGADYFLAALIMFLCFGGSVSYIMATSTLLHPVLQSSDNPSMRTKSMNKVFTSIVWLILMLPLVMMKRINSLRYFSSLGVLFIFYFVGCMVYHSVANGMQDPTIKEEMVVMRTGNAALQGLGSFLFAFMCQLNAFEIFHEQTHRTVFHFTLRSVHEDGGDAQLDRNRCHFELLRPHPPFFIMPVSLKLLYIIDQPNAFSIQLWSENEEEHKNEINNCHVNAQLFRCSSSFVPLEMPVRRTAAEVVGAAPLMGSTPLFIQPVLWAPQPDCTVTPSNLPACFTTVTCSLALSVSFEWEDVLARYNSLAGSLATGVTEEVKGNRNNFSPLACSTGIFSFSVVARELGPSLAVRSPTLRLSSDRRSSSQWRDDRGNFSNTAVGPSRKIERGTQRSPHRSRARHLSMPQKRASKVRSAPLFSATENGGMGGPLPFPKFGGKKRIIAMTQERHLNSIDGNPRKHGFPRRDVCPCFNLLRRVAGGIRTISRKKGRRPADTRQGTNFVNQARVGGRRQIVGRATAHC
eukprot:gene9452-6634_t